MSSRRNSWRKFFFPRDFGFVTWVLYVHTLNFQYFVFHWECIPSSPRVATLRAWYRSQKSLNSENTKKLRKQKTRLGPEDTKKRPKKKIQKWSILGHICNFSVIFSVFSGPNQGGGFCIFSLVFLSSEFRGFCDLYQARRLQSKGSSFFPGVFWEVARSFQTTNKELTAN